MSDLIQKDEPTTDWWDQFGWDPFVTHSKPPVRHFITDSWWNDNDWWNQGNEWWNEDDDSWSDDDYWHDDSDWWHDDSDWWHDDSDWRDPFTLPPTPPVTEWSYERELVDLGV